MEQPPLETPPASSPPDNPFAGEGNPFAVLRENPTGDNVQQQRPQAAAMTVPYERADEEDPADVHTKAATIKLEFQPDQVVFWFSTLEAKMRFAGIKSQWTKMQVVVTILPMQYASQIKDLLRVSEPTATGANTCYIDVKKRLLELFGPKEEDAYDVANQLLLTSTPSHLCRQIIDLVCPKHPKLDNDCCSTGMISGMWRSKLPKDIKTAIAGMSLGGGNLENVLRLADAVYNANHKKPAQVASLSGQASGGGAAAMPTAEELAAFRAAKNGANGKPNGGNKKKGGKGNAKANRQNKKSADNPPDSACNNHWEYGKKAYCCLNPLECPWKDYIAPRPKRT